MGTNHPGEIAYLSAIAQPDYAVITNIGIAHIEYLGSREGILREKLDILRSSLKNTVGIFNGDEPLLWNVRDKGTHKKILFRHRQSVLRRGRQRNSGAGRRHALSCERLSS